MDAETLDLKVCDAMPDESLDLWDQMDKWDDIKRETATQVLTDEEFQFLYGEPKSKKNLRRFTMLKEQLQILQPEFREQYVAMLLSQIVENTQKEAQMGQYSVSEMNRKLNFLADSYRSLESKGYNNDQLDNIAEVITFLNDN